MITPVEPLLPSRRSLHAALGPQLRWTCARFNDTGPVLRIEDSARPLSKAQRYGHPSGRPLHASSVPPATLAALVVSFLEYGIQVRQGRRGLLQGALVSAVVRQGHWLLLRDDTLEHSGVPVVEPKPPCKPLTRAL